MHWRALTESITQVLGLDYGTLQIRPEYINDGVWSGFVGAACERVSRDRRRDAYVAPLAELSRGMKAWLGLQERWEIDERNRRQFSFRELSLTVHFGVAGDPLKPQIFRSEWPGIRDWTGAGPGFQSPGAGHPHWQFDLQAALRAQQKDVMVSSLMNFDDETIEDFEAEAAQEPNVLALVRAATIERMHFASAAPWWVQNIGAAHPAHMNAPEDGAGLTRWILACIAYMRQELARCDIAVP
jgi:hypothetical protein